MTESAAEHPGTDALCDLDEGLLAGTHREADLQAHVAGCASCADFIALLSTTRERLAALPAEVMPADVAARIEDALAAESGRSADAAPDRATVVTPLRRSRQPRWVPAAGLVAAGVALLMAGALGMGVLTNVENGSKTTSGAAEKQSTPGAAGAPQDSSALRNYTADTLADEVRALVTGRSVTGAVPQTKPSTTPQPLGSQRDAVGPTDLARLHTPAGLAACVAELAGTDGVSALAVDYALFEGAPAAVIVLPDRDPAVLQAWVVGPACSTGNADIRYREAVSRSG